MSKHQHVFSNKWKWQIGKLSIVVNGYHQDIANEFASTRYTPYSSVNSDITELQLMKCDINFQ